MRRYLQSINRVQAPSETVWRIIKKGDEVEKWHPLVNSSYMKNKKRFCKTDQGELEETFLVRDEATKTFKYHINKQSVYPVKNEIISTIKIVEGKESTLLLWDIEFDTEDDQLFKEMKVGFHDVASITSRNLSE